MKYFRVFLVIIALAVPSAHVRAAGDRSDELYTAVRSNDLARLEMLIRSGADVNTKDEHGETPLMYSAAVGSLDAMKSLIAKGAAVNAQSESGLTALIMASTDPMKVRLLLDHGANVNAASKHGRTALFIAAMSDGSAKIVRLLVAKGANVKAVDAFRNTAMHAAATGNDTETIQMMVRAGIDVNAANAFGFTPLMITAGYHNNLRAVTLLLGKGANVNATGLPFMSAGDLPKTGPVALGSLTPLLLSAPFGTAELIKMLIDAGADVNAKDDRKMTPLMLAVATDHQDPRVIRMLLERGADSSLKSNVGQTAMDWARKVGAPLGIEILQAQRPQVAPLAVAASAAVPIELRTAVERSVTLLEETSQVFFDKSGCISCHHQSITELTVAETRGKGLRINEKAAQERIKMVKAGFPVEAFYERLDSGIPEITTYSMAALAAAGYLPDRMTDSMAANLAAAQLVNGSWRLTGGVGDRPPGEEGDIFRTALSVRSLKVYGPPGRGAEMQARIAKARQWLLAAKPVTTEDRNMQLLGLSWAGANTNRLRLLAKTIIAEQQADGGWRQRDGLASDAYATGESLYALAKTGGLAPNSPEYQRGVKFLLTTQYPDGSWHVISRAPKIQTFFQSGFPHGADQWISSWATGWATMALAQAIEGPGTRAAK